VCSLAGGSGCTTNNDCVAPKTFVPFGSNPAGTFDASASCLASICAGLASIHARLNAGRSRIKART
jgi:hypothetical protein